MWRGRETGRGIRRQRRNQEDVVFAAGTSGRGRDGGGGGGSVRRSRRGGGVRRIQNKSENGIVVNGFVREERRGLRRVLKVRGGFSRNGKRGKGVA